MNRSRTTSVLLSFPPARRLYDAVRDLYAGVSRLAADQDSTAASVAELRAEQQRLSHDIRRLSDALVLSPVQAQAELAQAVAPAPVSAAIDAGELEHWVGRELQSAALRNLPFLPGEISGGEDGIRVEGYAGAPEGLTDNMAFFVNGRRFDKVEYPISDPELKSRFSEVEGMGLVFRGRMTQHLDELRAARFWRFDASPSGHYVEGRWRQAIHFMNPAFEQFPVPPVPNIQRVIGDTNATRFAMGGAMIFKNLERYLGERDQSWADFPNVLDWGCGAGRVTRYFLSETSCAVTGADIDSDNIGWCRQNYPKGHFEVVPLRPPTGFADGSFDLVIGLSVLTHLQESDQWLWLSELQRITKPGALLFLSVQGPTQFAYNRFPSALYRRLQDQGFIDLSRDPALDAVIADPEYYRAAMHSRRYIRERWGDYFEILAIEDAIAGLQDFVVMRRRSM